nr:PREDICTED: uncharacterized protein LOC107077445 [Lepisosteus oculatus]
MELALGLAALALILVAPAVGRELRRNNLAITLVRELADPHRTGPEPEARPSLTLSTLTLCPPGRAHCSTCVRAQVALPCRVLPRNIVLDFLELSSNRHWEVRVRGRRRATTETWKWQEQRRAWKILEPPDPQLNSSHTPRTWQLSYECFEAEGGRDVLVSVSSSELQEPVSVAYTVEDSERGTAQHTVTAGSSLRTLQECRSSPCDVLFIIADCSVQYFI